MIQRRHLLRFSWNAARYALGPLSGLLIPWLVIHQATRAVWGGTVAVMIAVQLAAHVMHWGSRDLLLREFARAPERVAVLWRDSLFTRTLLALPVVVVILLLPATRTFAGPVIWVMLLFLGNSFEALIIWRKRFAQAAWIDATALVLQLAAIQLTPTVGVGEVVRCVLIGQSARVALLTIVFRSELSLSVRFDPRTHLLAALPFFLIALSGLLGSRMDLYVMNAISGRDAVGTYQVVAGFYVHGQAVAGLISGVFARELYGMDHDGVGRATGRLARAGLVFVAVITVAAHLLFTYFYHFHIPVTAYVAGAILAWPQFAFSPMVLMLFREGHERVVVIGSFCAAIISGGATWYLVPQIGLTGGLLAAALGQFAMLALVRRGFTRSRPRGTPHASFDRLA